MDNVESGTKVLEQVDAGRRAAVRRFIGVAFAAPVVTSFSLTGLGVNEAHAYVRNNLNPPTTSTTQPLQRITLNGGNPTTQQLQSWRSFLQRLLARFFY
jgi:hypothetical protein